MSTDPNKSAFANWTKFWVPYCDGSIHQGYTKEPVKYKGHELYFRGSAIFRAHIKWIDTNYDLKGAEKILFTGMSAGGLAVNGWNRYIRDFVNNDSKLYMVSDASIFFNCLTIEGQPFLAKSLQNLYKVANVDEAHPNKDCIKNFPG
jgi:O-palmitoleoyl-L-serine hydrolase